jgi:hypothetical protein
VAVNPATRAAIANPVRVTNANGKVVVTNNQQQ